MKKKPLQRRRSRPRSLRKHVERLTLLGDLGRILNSTLDQKEVRRRAIEAVTRLMEAEVGSLLLVDEERNQLYFEVALGDEEEEIKKITLKMGEGIAGWVAQSGEPLIVNAPEKDPRFFNGVDGKTEFKTRNLICVPVKAILSQFLGIELPQPLIDILQGWIKPLNNLVDGDGLEQKAVSRVGFREPSIRLDRLFFSTQSLQQL